MELQKAVMSRKLKFMEGRARWRLGNRSRLIIKRNWLWGRGRSKPRKLGLLKARRWSSLKTFYCEYYNYQL